MVDLSAHVDLEASLGRLTKRLDDDAVERRRAREQAKARIPSDVRVVAGAYTPANTTTDLALSLGGPDAGYYWMVRRLVVGGQTFTTTAAGTGEVYVTPIGTGSAGGGTGAGTYATIRSLSDLADQFTALPGKNFYGDHQFIVNPGENIVVVIRNPNTASIQYVASAQIQQIRSVTSVLEYEV